MPNRLFAWGVEDVTPYSVGALFCCLRIEILFVQNRAVARVVEGRQPLPVCAGLLFANRGIVCAESVVCTGAQCAPLRGWCDVVACGWCYRLYRIVRLLGVSKGANPYRVCAFLLFADRGKAPPSGELRRRR